MRSGSGWWGGGGAGDAAGKGGGGEVFAVGELAEEVGRVVEETLGFGEVNEVADDALFGLGAGVEGDVGGFEEVGEEEVVAEVFGGVEAGGGGVLGEEVFFAEGHDAAGGPDVELGGVEDDVLTLSAAGDFAEFDGIPEAFFGDAESGAGLLEGELLVHGQGSFGTGTGAPLARTAVTPAWPGGRSRGI